MKYQKIFLSLLIAFVSLSSQVSAQQGLLEDADPEETFTILAYGDSLTYGVGDGIPTESLQETVEIPATSQGYPSRIANLLGLIVQNEGLPGDLLSEDAALQRFPATLRESNANAVILFEGENDAIFRVSPERFRSRLQKLINIAQHQERQVVLTTLPPPCCDRKERALFTRAYSQQIRLLSLVNEIPLTEVEQAWDLRCPVSSECDLVNRPEGLHPNQLGYDFLSQMFVATILGIDPLSPEGPELLSEAIDIPLDSILVIPNEQEQTDE